MPFFDIFKDTSEIESLRLSSLLKIGLGSKVGEVGAGKGKLAIAMSGLVGSEGKVYATEQDPKRLEAFRRNVNNEDLRNVAVILGRQESSGLPQGLDAVYVRMAYHHFSYPEMMDRNIFAVLKPGGRLAILDFPPKRFLWFCRPKGVPKNRGGHGIPKTILEQEILSAGFNLIAEEDDWPGGLYCVVFEKPKS